MKLESNATNIQVGLNHGTAVVSTGLSKVVWGITIRFTYVTMQTLQPLLHQPADYLIRFQ